MDVRPGDPIRSFFHTGQNPSDVSWSHDGRFVFDHFYGGQQQGFVFTEPSFGQSQGMTAHAGLAMGQRCLDHCCGQSVQPVECVQRVDGSSGIFGFGGGFLENSQRGFVRTTTLHEQAAGGLAAPVMWAAHFVRESGGVQPSHVRQRCH